MLKSDRCEMTLEDKAKGHSKDSKLHTSVSSVQTSQMKQNKKCTSQHSVQGEIYKLNETSRLSRKKLTKGKKDSRKK